MTEPRTEGERYRIGSHFSRNRWFVFDRQTDEPVSEHKTREAAIAAADRLNVAATGDSGGPLDVERLRAAFHSVPSVGVRRRVPTSDSTFWDAVAAEYARLREDAP